MYFTTSNETIACFPGNFLHAPIDFDTNRILTGSLSTPRAILYNHNLNKYINIT